MYNNPVDSYNILSDEYSIGEEGASSGPSCSSDPSCDSELASSEVSSLPSSFSGGKGPAPSILPPATSSVLGFPTQEDVQGLSFAASAYSLGLTCVFGKVSSCLESLPSAALAIPGGLAYFGFTGAQSEETDLLQSVFGQYAGTVSALLSYVPFISLAIGILEGSTKVEIPLAPIQFTTTYTASPTNITITNSTPYNFSPVGQVYNGNYKEAPNYLTCPANASSLRPTTDLYFYANKNTGVAGDTCLATNTTYTSTLYGLTTSITIPPVDEFVHILASVGSGGYVTGVSQLNIANPGLVASQDLGYTPSVDGVLSNGWNTSSYIFDEVPSLPQHGIWSWNLVIPAFSSVPLPKSSNLFFTIQTVAEPGTSGICLYSGPYFEQTTLESISTNYIPFTEVEHNASSVNYNSTNRLTFDSAVYPYLQYNYILTENNSASVNNPNFTGMSEDIYSPWNYYTPADSEDQFPINLPSLLFARSTTKGNQAITITENGSGPESSAVQTPVAAYRQSIDTNLSVASLPLIYPNYSSLVPNALSLTLLNPLASPGIVTQGAASLLADDPVIGGTPPYKYQWSVEPPGSSSYSMIPSTNSTTYYFQTAWNSTIGTYNFSLTATDSSRLINATTGAIYNLTVTKHVSVAVVSTSFPLTDPISMTAIANDYVYVLYNESGNYTIGIVRLYPHGSYPAPVTMPSTNVTCGGTGSWSGSSCAGAWDSEWQSYWDQVINEQNNTAYLVYAINLPNVVYVGGNALPFVPYNISADKSGDIFISGKTSGKQAILAKVLNILTPQGEVCYGAGGCDQFSSSGPISSVPGNLTEIAAAPASGDIYLAGPGANGIEVFSSNNFTLLRTLPLLFSNDTAIAGSALPFSQPANATPLSGTLNITEWLQQSGPFWINTTKTIAGSNNLDQENYHHPLAIADINGYLYILDDWAGVAGGNSFDFLNLRAMDANGTEIPLNPSPINNVANLTARQKSLLNWEVTQGVQYEFPPYGVMLSGEVNGISFCSSSVCNNHPEANETYYPIGPKLNQSSCSIAAPSCAAVGFSAYPNGRLTMLLPSQSNGFGFGELLLLDMNPYNYTQLLKGLPPYDCYVPSNVNSVICGSYNIGQIAPPVYGVDDPFGYLENLGSQTVLSYSGQYFSEFPKANATLVGASCAKELSNFSYPTACGAGNVTITPQISENITHILNSVSPGSSVIPNGQLTANYTVLENVTSLLESHLYLITNQTFLGEIEAFLNQTSVFANKTLLFNQSYSSNRSLESLSAIYELQRGIMAKQVYILNGEPDLLNNQTATGANVSSSLQTLESLESKNNTSVLNETRAYLNQLVVFTAEKDLVVQESGILENASISSNATSIKPPVTELSSGISGNAWVSYKYNYNTFQWWGPYIYTAGAGPHNICLPVLPFVGPDNDKYTTYAYAPTQFSSSPPLTAAIEGGNSYVSYPSGTNSSYYVPSISDTALYLSQHLIFNLSSDRGFGSAYIANLNLADNEYSILNATQQLNYIIKTVDINTLKYEIIATNAIGPNYGPQYSGTGIIGADVPANFIFNESLNQPPYLRTVFPSSYQTELYHYILDLYLPETLGYNRLVYVFTDTFNNSIYMPLDSDIAKITSLEVNVTPEINETNSNQTRLEIRGVAGEKIGLGPVPSNYTFTPLPNASVVLYFNHNLDYLGLDKEQEQLCAFGSPTYQYNTTPFPSECKAAPPGSQGISNSAAYLPEYNASGTCAPPPKNLSGASVIDCNIYGRDNHSTIIPALCPPAQSGAQAYCVPSFLNGSGTCTTQVGLIGTSTTNATGGFNASIKVCGSGMHNVIAEYYGEPEVQPATVYQPPLNESASPLSKKLASLGSQSLVAPLAPSLVLDYHWTPNVTISSTFSTGLFLLSIGDVEAILAVIVLIVVLLMLFLSRRKKKRVRRRARK